MTWVLLMSLKYDVCVVIKHFVSYAENQFDLKVYTENTWSLVPLPLRNRPIGCRWVYKIKYHLNGLVDRHNARLDAKG